MKPVAAQPLPPLSPATFRIRLVLGVLLLNLVVIALTGITIRQSHHQYQERAEITTSNLAQLLENEIATSLRDEDIALLTVLDEYQRQRASGGIDASILNTHIERVRSRLPEIDALRITDAQGVLVYGSDVNPATKISLADRPHFIRLRNDPQAGLVLSKPQLSRVNHKWVIVLARRINLPDGSFGGMAFAAIALEHFSRTFAALNIGRHGNITLRSTELDTIIRHPELPDGSTVGHKGVSRTLGEMLQAGQKSGTYMADSGLDGIERTFSYRHIGDYPLFIVVGLATADYFAEWRKNTVTEGALIALFTLITLLSAWTIYRTWNRQHEALQELAHQEAKFRTVADFTYDWEYWQGADRQILYMTPSCERITGYTQAEFIADPGLLQRIIYPDDRQLMDRHLDSIAHEDKSLLDFRIVRRDGEIRWILHHCHAITGTDNLPMGRRVSNRDITERKQAEELVLASETRLLEAQRIAQIGSWELDLVGGKLIWSDEIFRIFEIDKMAFGASYEAFLNAIHPEDREAVNQAYSESVANHTPYEITHRLLMADGRIKWVTERCETYYDTTGKPLRSTGTVQDITARKLAEDRLRELNETLELRVEEAVHKNMEQERLLIQQSRLAAMGEMVHNIAHQWRQPLNALGLLQANIKDSFEYGDLNREMMEQFVEDGQRLIQKMSTTIDDFRDFFKPQREKSSFSLHSAIEHALSIISASIQNHGIEISVEMGEDVHITGYPNEFSQVLLNILNNAKEAILAKHVSGGKIHITLGTDGKECLVIVRDNGCGVPETVLPKIFDPYFTTKPKGTGIGLYMSRMIMEHMGGAIEARNIDDGMEFRMLFPLQP